MATPLISVVVPAYDAARFLPATLESVLAQTEQQWECIVVDDGSSDDTYPVASGFARGDPRFRAVRIEHGGVCRARNEGFRLLAQGSRFVSFMDSDDVWLPHALETLLARMQRDEGLVGSHGLAEFIDAEGQKYAPGAYAETGRDRWGLEGRRLVRWSLDRPTTFDVLINGNVLFPPGLLLAQRDAYERAGPFDEALDIAADWDMLIRLSRFGDLDFVDDVILLYRRHDANMGAQPATPAQAWLVRCIAFHSPENSPAQQRIARRGWRAYQLQMVGRRTSEAAAALRERRLREAFDRTARVIVHAWRYIRGYPRPRVRREPLVW